MERTGEKHAMGSLRGGCKPATVCEFPNGTALSKRVPFDETLDLRNLPFTQTEHVLLALAKIVEQRDKHTAGHCERLAVMSVALGVAMKLDHDHLLALYLGGFLHDVGKVGVPDSVLFKPDKLNDEEWEIMRAHTVHGEEICRPLVSLSCVLPIIRHHHERLDGTGYPDGLRGTEIPLLARVLQVADIYDALTNPRPYKRAFTTARALEILEEEASRGWRDPEITRLFVRLHKRMVSRIGEYQPGAAADVASMQDSLAHLQDFLAH
ncbi:MAG: metal dependent phosphohydrolase [Candidatus Solibacter sp.]|nr:metal dependent phosphohydrolase [Candidatus Solibacter sp.]